MATLSRAAFVLLPTLLITAIVLGSSRVRTGQSQDSMTSTKAEPTSLLDLLDDAQADARRQRRVQRKFRVNIVVAWSTGCRLPHR